MRKLSLIGTLIAAIALLPMLAISQGLRTSVDTPRAAYTAATAYTDSHGGNAVAAAITATNGGAGNAGRMFKADGNGKIGGRVLETDGTKLDALPGSMGAPGTIGGVTPAAATFTNATANTAFLFAAGADMSCAAGATDLDLHLSTGVFQFGASSATLAFFGVSAVPRASAYTQTYSTAARTVPNDTSHTITDSTGGTPSTTVLAAQASSVGGAVDPTAALAADVNAQLVIIRNNMATLAAELALTKADHLAIKKVANSLIDDSQAYGLAQ